MCGAACGGCKRGGRSNNIWMDSRLSVNMGMTAQCPGERNSEVSSG